MYNLSVLFSENKDFSEKSDNQQKVLGNFGKQSSLFLTYSLELKDIINFGNH